MYCLRPAPSRRLLYHVEQFSSSLHACLGQAGSFTTVVEQLASISASPSDAQLSTLLVAPSTVPILADRVLYRQMRLSIAQAHSRRLPQEVFTKLLAGSRIPSWRFVPLLTVRAVGPNHCGSPIWQARSQRRVRNVSESVSARLCMCNPKMAREELWSQRVCQPDLDQNDNF